MRNARDHGIQTPQTHKRSNQVPKRVGNRQRNAYVTDAENLIYQLMWRETKQAGNEVDTHFLKAKMAEQCFTGFPFMQDCTTCEELASVSGSFSFAPILNNKISTLDTKPSGNSDNWTYFKKSGDGIRLVSSKEQDEFGEHRRTHPGRACGHYWIGDTFGVITSSLRPADHLTVSSGIREVRTCSPDYSLLLQWLNHCCQHHESCKPRYSDRLHSIRLIDVQSRTLVAYPLGYPLNYIALSYVWGNISLRSFALGPLPDKLPATIEDAIEVTRQLKMRYLWTDYVCIDQEDHEYKRSQINIMDSIYSGAFATIISLNGESANEGIPRAGTTERARPQMTMDFGRGNKLVSAMPSLMRQLRHSIWAQRGWTFQEGILSNRRLLFTRHQVYFACNSLICSESNGEITSVNQREGLADPYPLLKSVQRLPHDQASPSLTSISKQKMYSSLTNSYVTRKLSYEPDALNAFLGILKILEQLYFPEGFRYGLPQAHFRHSLLWRRAMEHQIMSENKCWGRNDCFPNWSWVGWKLSVPLSWLWIDEHRWCHITQPPLRFWTQQGDPIDLPSPICSCSPVKKSQVVPSSLLNGIEKVFGGLSTPDDNIFQCDSKTKHAGCLTVEGILVEIEIVRCAQEVYHFLMYQEAKSRIPFTINLTEACETAIESGTWSFYIDIPWKLLLEEDCPQKFDLLLVASNESFIPHSMGLGLHFLLLDWKDGVAYRVGVVDLHVDRLAEFKLEAATPRLRRFTLG
jgi:hypothetical protein